MNNTIKEIVLKDIEDQFAIQQHAYNLSLLTVVANVSQWDEDRDRVAEMFDAEEYRHYDDIDTYAAYLNYELKLEITTDLILAAVYSVLTEQADGLANYYIQLVLLETHVADAEKRATSQLDRLLAEIEVWDTGSEDDDDSDDLII